MRRVNTAEYLGFISASVLASLVLAGRDQSGMNYVFSMEKQVRVGLRGNWLEP